MVAHKVSHLTKEWYEKLSQELNDLTKKKLPQVLERLGDAKAMWDLSENFEYKSALEDRDLITSRIAEIEELIENVEIIKERKKGKWNLTIDYGSKVKLKLEDGKSYEVTIVGSGEVEVEWCLNISLESPIGMAIKGKKAWDITKTRILDGKKTIKILSVS